jgi:hypothetical protein
MLFYGDSEIEEIQGPAVQFKLHSNDYYTIKLRSKQSKTDEFPLKAVVEIHPTGEIEQILDCKIEQKTTKTIKRINSNQQTFVVLFVVS